MPAGRHARPGQAQGKPVNVSDEYMLNKLEAEGWLSRG